MCRRDAECSRKMLLDTREYNHTLSNKNKKINLCLHLFKL